MKLIVNENMTREENECALAEYSAEVYGGYCQGMDADIDMIKDRYPNAGGQLLKMMCLAMKAHEENLNFEYGINYDCG